MTDWKGNIITSGDTISIVATKDDFGRHGWCELESLDVKEVFGIPCMELVAIGNVKLYLDLLIINLWLGQDQIICIKGKSDNEQEYYLKYFEA